MKIIGYQEHTSRCGKTTRRQPSYFLFQYRFDFYVVLYCNCHNECGEVNAKQRWLDSFCDNRIKIDSTIGYVQRGITLKSAITNNKVNLILEGKIQELSYLYSDACYRDYAFTNDLSYGEYILFQSDYENKYNQARIELINSDMIKFESQRNELIESLDNIFNANATYYKSLTNDHLIKLTKQLNKNFLKAIA